MSRTVTVNLDGQEWHMPASYAASKDVAEMVGDPLGFALLAERNQLELTTDNVVTVIYIGCKHAGCNLTKDQVGDKVVDQGLADFIEIVGKYIASMVMGGPDKPVKGTSKKKTKTGSK